MIWFNLGCLVCFVGGSLLVARAKRRQQSDGWTWRVPVLGLVGLTLLGFGLLPAVWLVASVRGDSSPRSEQLTANIAYERQAVDRAVVHWASVPLDALESCIEVNASLPDAEGLIDASTATEYGRRTASDLVINVAFFYPIREYPHWSSYPTSGDPITAIGHVVVDGSLHGVESSWERYLMLDTANGTGSIGSLSSGELPSGLVAVPGRAPVVVDGVIARGPDVATNRYPRTVVGIDHDDNQLVLAVVDGKQFGYSNGLSLPAVGQLMIERGVDDALEFDGGGSATMVGQINDQQELLSRPAHTRIPGRERPVATFFGLVDNCD